MKFTCDRDDLNNCISIVQRAMPSRSAMSALEGILLRAKDGKVYMRCSDMIMTIDSHIEATVEQEGALVMPGKLFADLVRKLPAEPVSVSLMDEQNAIKVECGKARMTLHGMSEDEFPEHDETSLSQPLSIKQGLFKEMVQQTKFAVAVDETKPILTGELIEMDQSVFSIVALDGYRLAMRTEEMEGNTEQVTFVIPSKSISEMAALFHDDDTAAKILIGKDQVVVEMDNTKISTRLLEGEFIKYRAILPDSRNTRVRVNRAALADSTDRASLVAREGKNNLIKLGITEDMMTISANSEMGDVYEEIPIYMEGAPLNIAFNARYLTDVLKVIGDEEILMDFISNLSPCVIRPVEGEKFLYLVLPVRLYN